MEKTVFKQEKIARLSDVLAGKKCIIIKVHGHGGFRHRILEMGFVKNQIVSVIKNAPLQDPIEYKVLDSHISLRRSEARQIEVLEVDDDFSGSVEANDYFGTITAEYQEIIKNKQKTINVGLLGNPNSGKTSFFNFATGRHERVGNYAGVTVSAKVGVFKHNGYTINLIDLPGTYSLTEYTPEEKYVREFLAEETPDLVLNIIDASNLERNLFLTTQLIDMNLKIVVAINMFDELEKSGDELNYKLLGEMLGMPFIPTTAHKGIGISDVIEGIIDVYEDKRSVRKHIHINYGNTIEEAIAQIKDGISEDQSILDKYHSRYIALKLLEGDALAEEFLKETDAYYPLKAIVSKQVNVIEDEYKEDVEAVIANAKYGFIRGALKETFTHGDNHSSVRSEKIDNILTNKWLGFPILILFLYIMFQTTFTLGAYPQDWIDAGIGWFAALMESVLPEGMIKALLIDGIIAGVGGVIIFLPNIIFLFLFISIMEDTGYMARATFVLDKLMHKIGLHGRSFIPLLTGFGCSVPAIMATRTLENRKDRILTMLIIPFMSCAAKLPVYILFIAAFFPTNQGLILLSVYLIGILIAVISALVLKRTIFKKEQEEFVMELPPYRMPTLRNSIKHMWRKSAQYLKKMGGVILVASILIWALSYFPQSTPEQPKDSYIEVIGKSVAPVMKPLGFDWKMSVSLMTGFVAKETVVSTMGILYNTEDDDNLKSALQSEDYSKLAVFSFMLFVLLYCPCFAAIIVCKKETNLKWAVFMVTYTIFVAWVVSFLVYQIGSLLI